MTRIYASATCGVASAGVVVSSAAAARVHQREARAALSVLSWADSAAVQVSCDASWSAPLSAFGVASVAVRSAGQALTVSPSLPWVSPVPLAVSGAAGIAAASVSLSGGAVLELHQAAAQAVELVAPQLGADLYTIRPSEYDLRQSELLIGVSGDFNLTAGQYVPSAVVRIASFDLVDLPAFPIRAGAALRAYQPPEKTAESGLPWGEGEPLHYAPDLPYLVEPPVIPGGPISEPNAREVHILMNQVDVISLPDETPLSVADISMSLDDDSFSWRFSCDVLNDASIALLKPDASGNKELAVIVNGHRWEFFVASWGRSRVVNGNKLDKRFTVSGYSRSQYLALPYAPKRTRSISSTTAVQAATNELFGTGYTLNWNTSDLPDWSMPGATFSYQELAPLQVIKRLAATAGAVVQPALATDEITVRPRYWPAPWELASATMDKTIHESQILSEGGQLEYRDQINSVFVSGESAGVSATITRYGTAGDVPGQDIVEPWLTAQEANVSRGRQEIAAGGDRVIHTLGLAIPEGTAEPGLLLPGQTVAVVYDDEALSYRGYVMAVSISVPGNGLAQIIQTVTIEQPVGWEE
ncbi:MAG: hypothetical protein VYA77_08355 [Pseudomonadota bacterium]|nr:hypothetical protein [Pseudomonadota bacterium]